MTQNITEVRKKSWKDFGFTVIMEHNDSYVFIYDLFNDTK